MGSSYFEVIQHVEEYFRVHLPYTVIEIRRQSYCAEKECLYMVAGKKNDDDSYAVWLSWNDRLGNLSLGHYNLSSPKACAQIMTKYQAVCSMEYDENSSALEFLYRLLVKNDECFKSSYQELLYIRGYIDGIIAQQEYKWDKLTDTEINMLLGEAKD